MEENKPVFLYYPDPVGTGSIEKSDVTCICCELSRGYIYTGPVYSIEELDALLCPWCIADGSAHKKFGASFTYAGALGNYGTSDAALAEVISTIAYRTPGFIGWQESQWWKHCGDAGVFLGPMGFAELREFGEQAVKAIKDESGQDDNYVELLDKEGCPTAYLFKCRHCGEFGGYSDYH